MPVNKTPVSFKEHSDWRPAVRGFKLFIYWRNEMTPRYIFEKKSTLGNWIGHGQYFMSMTKVLEWVRSQPRKP